jgi:2-iminobutanoate/2-iminopropanoate deaminase
MKIITTDKAPAPVGPYSQAIAHGGMLFCSGQIPLDPTTGEMIGKTAAEQAEQVLKNMAAVLKAGGSSMNQVIKTTIFLQNINDFTAVNAVYEKAFDGHKPARSTVEVAKLPKSALVEIECVAAI